MGLIDIKSMTTEEITALMEQFGQPKFRAKQIFSWLHSGVDSFDEMTNLPVSLRQKLQSECYIADVAIERKLVSQIDGTVKYLYRLYDGEYIESVLMSYNHGYTVCISTQVGCRMGCSFCASGLNGRVRDLTASEMLAQIKTAEKDNGIRVSNVVMMGMGEPLDNYDNSVRFLRLVSHDDGMNIGLRHISLSTSGVVTGIEKLAKENMPITLSISLHAPFDDMRSKMMPVNKKWNVAALISACKDYQKVTGRRISFEYAMIKDVNDSKECADALIKLLRGIMCHVNLIPANPVIENNFKRSDDKSVNNFCEYLNSKGLNTTIRRTLGADIDASCGQLRNQKKRRDDNENCE